MSDTWSKIFESTTCGRVVIGETYDGHEYKIKTTQKSEDKGNVSGDQSSTVIISPSAAGAAIEIHATTLSELENNLITDAEFTDQEAKEIVEKFRT